MEAGAQDKRSYDLHAQVGYLLRTASQRHTAIFMELMVASLTRPQFGALVQLFEGGLQSQNELGRASDMDQVTIKGVVDRLNERGLIERLSDPEDRRRYVIGLSAEGRRVVQDAMKVAPQITRRTLAPLTREEADTLVRLLRKIS